MMLLNRMYMNLSELAGIVDDLINEAFYGQTYWIVAETADVKNYPDRQYCFVTLVEKEGKNTLARMEAVIWTRYYSEIAEFESITGKSFDKNIKVLLKVSVDFSPVYGLKLQIIAIDPSYTLGEMEKTRQQTLERLVSENPGIIRYHEGIYDTYNKGLVRPLVFQRIALITAPDSDGRRDFLHELQSNPHGYSFYCEEYLTRIQGEGAEYQIMDRLNQIKSGEKSMDAVIIVRGGGSQLDFGPFDTYDLGLLIASFPIPVITGIGHERNVSIADEMSHLRVKTPTKAASFLIEHNHSFEEEIIRMKDEIFKSASQVIVDQNDNLDSIMESLGHSIKNYLNNQNNKLDKIGIALKHLDPVNILNRGFAMVMKEDVIITDPGKLKPGDIIDVRLKRTNFQSLIQNITETDED